MPSDPRYRWDSQARVYRHASNGRAVNPAVIRAALDKTIEGGAERMGALCAQLQDGQITVRVWQQGMAQAMKEMHVASAAAARGGWAQMRPADYGRAGRRLRDQYAYLRNFARQIESGEQALDGRFVQRAQMYAQSSRGTYEATRRNGEREAGMKAERRVLHPAEHCDECVEAAGRGWQPIGTLPEIGSLQCGPNCKCSVEYAAEIPTD